MKFVSLLLLVCFAFSNLAFAEKPVCLSAGDTGGVGGVPGRKGWKLDPPCCKGLVDRNSPKTCEEPVGGSYQYICLACGDKKCDAPYETSCNCPEDCKPANGPKAKNGKVGFGTVVRKNTDKVIYVSPAGFGRRLAIQTQNGVCDTSGPNAYGVQADESGENFYLICDSQPSWDSKIPIEQIKKFKYPDSIYVDQRAFDPNYGGSEMYIKTAKKPWGKEYSWETPTSGSTKYIYICPTSLKNCMRIKVGGLEKLTIDVEPLKKDAMK